MTNKLLLCLAVAASFCEPSYGADSCPIRSGAYAGLSFGASVLSNGGNVTFDQGVGNSSIKGGATKVSPALGFFGGYGLKINSLWIGAEVFYQFDKLTSQTTYTTTDNSSLNVTTRATGAYGSALHLGFAPINNCLVYAIAGVEVRKFKVKSSGDILAAGINKTYTSIAFAPGLGVRFALSQNLSLRTEYKYAMHRSKSSSDKGIRAGNMEAITYKSSPKIHSFNIGLVYSF